MKEMARYGLILGTTCFIASSVLAVVNTITAPRIAAQKAQDENRALTEVFPAGKRFEPRADGQNTAYYRAYDAAGKLIGFVLKAEGKGYSSHIETLTGIDSGLGITAIKILSQNETPGLGTRITEPAFQDQFKGKRMETVPQIQTITGATISSGAVVNAIKSRLTALTPVLREELKNAK